jgi:hypothetical protein
VQKASMWIALGNMTQQNVLLRICCMGHQLDGDVADKWKTFIIVRNQTGKWIFQNDASGMLWMIELFRQIHKVKLTFKA